MGSEHFVHQGLDQKVRNGVDSKWTYFSSSDGQFTTTSLVRREKPATIFELASNGSVPALASCELETPSPSASPFGGRLKALGLRETAKSDLLLGYAVIRRALVELDARFQLNGGIFFLLPDELPRLLAGDNLSETISARRKRRQQEPEVEGLVEVHVE